MFEAPFRNDKPFDIIIEQNVERIKKHITEKDDDFVILIVGDTGGGKSTLALHMLEMFMPEERLNINQVALSKEEFASSLKVISTEPKPRAILYDEANVNKRDSLSKWNKELIDLYFSCRGLNIFHIWCNPSLQMIDKVFIEDRLRGIVFIRKNPATTNKKHKDEIRYFYYFRKGDILAILKKYENLNIKTISKYRKKYSWFRGWFKEYKGVLKKPYLEKKKARMEVKVSQFFDKYAEDVKLTKRSDVVKMLMIGDNTISSHMHELTQKEDYQVNPNGRYFFTDSGIVKLKEILINQSKKKFKKGVSPYEL